MAFASSGTLRFSSASGTSRSLNVQLGFSSTASNSSLETRHDLLFDWYSKPNWTSGNPAAFSEFYSAVEDNPLGGGCCVLEGSNIELWNGQRKKVEDIVVGDELLAFQIDGMNHEAEETSEYVKFHSSTLTSSLKTRTYVTQLVKTRNPNLVEINEKLVMTDFDIVLVFKANGDPYGNHEGKNLWLWLPAQAIEVGDKIVGKNFQQMAVTSVHHRPNRNRINTYALDCEPYDWFYANGILVHNKGLGGGC